MKDKILKEVMEWYDNHEEKNDVYIEDFVDLVIDKTTNALLDEINDELKVEFNKGNLKHLCWLPEDSCILWPAPYPRRKQRQHILQALTAICEVFWNALPLLIPPQQLYS